MKLTDPKVYQRYAKAVAERWWPVRLLENIRDRQERLLLARRGGRFGILVGDDREAVAWRRLEMLRGRILEWINYRDKDLDGLRQMAEFQAEMREGLSG